MTTKKTKLPKVPKPPFMTAAKYQQETPLTAVYPQQFALEYLTLGLASEAGEVAGKLKKLARGDYNTLPLSTTETSSTESPNSTAGSLCKTDLDTFHKDFHAEIGDVLWYISELCRTTGTRMEELMAKNITKLHARAAKDTLKGSGDKR